MTFAGNLRLFVLALAILLGWAARSDAGLMHPGWDNQVQDWSVHPENRLHSAY